MKRIAFYLLLAFWVVINTYFVFALKAQSMKNLNASSSTAYFNLEMHESTTEEKSWSISFNRTLIEMNTGISVQVVDQSFEQVLEAPKMAYLNSLPKGSGNSWYEYDMFSHSITPLPNKTIVVKLPSNKYVKIEIQSYYKDGTGDSGYYTFRYDFIK